MKPSSVKHQIVNNHTISKCRISLVGCYSGKNRKIRILSQCTPQNHSLVYLPVAYLIVHYFVVALSAFLFAAAAIPALHSKHLVLSSSIVILFKLCSEVFNCFLRICFVELRQLLQPMSNICLIKGDPLNTIQIRVVIVVLFIYDCR